MTQNADFSLREAHNHTLHLLLDRGNLTYLFIAVGSILSASILGFILLMVTGAPIMGHLITILIKLATAFAVFVLASKTIDNIARINKNPFPRASTASLTARPCCNTAPSSPCSSVANTSS